MIQQLLAPLALTLLALGAVAGAERDLLSVIDQLESEQRALRLAFRAQERPPVSADDVLARAGRDPAALHRFVHEETCWVPYRGSLRGVTGMLIDGSGSHLDRALLLAEALRAAGFAVRLEGGSLADEAVAEGLARELARSRQQLVALPDPGLSDPALEERFAAALGVSLDDYRAQRARLSLRSQEAQEEALLRSIAQAGHLQDLLGDDFGTAGDATDIAAIFAEHWWVAYRPAGGEEAWRRLDPLQSPADAGTPLAAATATIPWDAEAELAPEHRHRLRLRAIAETWRDGERSEHVLLEAEIDPRERWLDALQLACLPLGWSASGLADADPAAVEAAMLEQDSWWPMVAVGEADNLRQAAIDDQGRIEERPVERAEQRRLQEGTRLLAGMDGGADGAAFTALWWEWTWLGPGADERPRRRMMMDVIGPAVRAEGGFSGELTRDQRLQRAIQLSSVTRVACLPGRTTPAVVRRLSMVHRLRNHGALVGSLDALERGDEGAFVERIAAVTVPAVQLHNWAMLRWVWSRHRARTFVDRPQVIGLHVLTAGEERSIRLATDVVHHGVGVLPAEPPPDDAPPAPTAAAIRLEQGVLDTVLETLVLRGYGEALGGNPSTLMEAGGDWALVEDPAATELAADWRTRLAADRAEGFAVVAPNAAIGERELVGWWRVDPATGECLGLGINGWGPEGAEEISVLATMTRAQIAVLRAQMFLAHNYQKIAYACAICKLSTMGLTIAGVNLPQETDLVCGVVCAGAGEE